MAVNGHLRTTVRDIGLDRQHIQIAGGPIHHKYRPEVSPCQH